MTDMRSGAASAGELIRQARVAAGLTQAELAARTDTTQSAVARLERAGANTSVATLRRVLAACGRRLVLESAPAQAVAPRPSSVDETLVASRLRLTPAKRLQSFQRAYAQAAAFAAAGARSRGELA